MKHVIVLAALLATGCAGALQHTVFTPTNPAPRALVARPASEVEVYSATAPQRPFVEVGLVFTESATSHGRPLVGQDGMVEGLRAEAAARGCDGIILGPNAAATYQAACIVYR